MTSVVILWRIHNHKAGVSGVSGTNSLRARGGCVSRPVVESVSERGGRLCARAVGVSCLQNNPGMGAKQEVSDLGACVD